MSTGISLERVQLHYSCVAYKERSLKALLSRPFGHKSLPAIHDIHALRDITLRVQPGERVGVLGRNGAGKTTLLRMIAGLYPISGGTRIVEGKIRSILELNLGFEPDATGRENILYRGLLLGMTPGQMRSMSDEIISFADVGEFIDFPIKTYSAGMQVRLAFAISTAVGGALLLLDEVIGAGDAAFMTKAKRRIHELISRAEILILASHDESTLRTLCDRGIVLRSGSVVFDGSIGAAVKEYGKLLD